MSSDKISPPMNGYDREPKISEYSGYIACYDLLAIVDETNMMCKKGFVSWKSLSTDRESNHG